MAVSVVALLGVVAAVVVPAQAVAVVTNVSGDVTRAGVAFSVSDSVQVGFADGGTTTWATVGAGHYDVYVAPGQYEVYIQVETVTRHAGTVTVMDELSQIENFDLPALVDLSGQVVTTAGAIADGVLVASDFGGLDGFGGYALASGGDGHFTLDMVDVGGQLTIAVNRQSRQSLYTGRYYAGPGNLGSATAAGATKVTVSQTTVLGQTVLDTCGTVSGTVDPIVWEHLGPDLSVVVFNDDNPDLVTRSAPVAADASFTVTGLLPGSYYAALVETASSVTLGYYDGVSPAEAGSPNIVVSSTCAGMDGLVFVVPVIGPPLPSPPTWDPPTDPPTLGPPPTPGMVPPSKPALASTGMSAPGPAGTSGGVSGPGSATPGALVKVKVGSTYAGQDVEVYLFSDPVFLGQKTVDSDGTIEVKLPDGVTGTHKLAVYALSGALIGWDTITISAPAKGAQVAKSAAQGTRGLPITGAAVAPVAITIGVCVVAGLALVVARARRRV
ncbi:MAG: hypothetical protein FWF02_04385 [Micrococcales bacterium]|nr:hypothetical protein [Micrococcales bacterium]MCL2666929.1 hypothetical protein [Micrococcales bacterium]